MPTSKRSRKPYIILGIDPGYADMGYGVISITASGARYVACDTIKSSKKKSMPDRLFELDSAIKKLLTTYTPDLVAVEKIFFAANQKTAIEVAQARGLALMEAAAHNVPVVEYTPMQVKLALTSYGQADKKQVAHMVAVLLKEKKLPDQDDALDALAIAICASFHAKIQKP